MLNAPQFVAQLFNALNDLPLESGSLNLGLEIIPKFLKSQWEKIIAQPSKEILFKCYSIPNFDVSEGFKIT